MSTKSSKKKASRFQLEEALTNTLLALSIWHASRGSVGEPLAERMVRDLAEHYFKGAQPDAMVRIQAAVLHFNAEALKENPDAQPSIPMPEVDANGSPVASDPSTTQ